MKKTFINEYLKKSISELVNLRNEGKRELFNLRMKNSLRWLKETHFINTLRKNIARINTALSYKLKSDGNNLK